MTNQLSERFFEKRDDPTIVRGADPFGFWQAWMDGSGQFIRAMNQEWLDYTERRTADELTFPLRLIGCYRSSDLVHVFFDLWRRSWEDYANEMVRLSRIQETVANATLKEVQDSKAMTSLQRMN